jgi:uncharacterized alpha-E superfamily protein
MHPNLDINPLAYENNVRRIFSSISISVSFYFPALNENLARLEKTLRGWHVVDEYATILSYKERAESATDQIQSGLAQWISAINGECDGMSKAMMELVGRYARPD